MVLYPDIWSKLPRLDGQIVLDLLKKGLIHSYEPTKTEIKIHTKIQIKGKPFLIIKLT